MSQLYSKRIVPFLLPEFTHNILYYVEAIVIEINGVNFNGLIMYLLPLIYILKNARLNKESLAFLKVRELSKDRVRNLFAVNGFCLFLTIIIFSGMVWSFQTFGSDAYTEFLEGVVDTFSGGNLNKNLFSKTTMLITSIVLAPLLEEIFFRGFIYDYFDVKYPKYNIAINALLFGLAHGGLLPHHYISGYVMAKLRQKDDDIYGALFLHILNNLLVEVQEALPTFSGLLLICFIVYFFYYIIQNRALFKKSDVS